MKDKEKDLGDQEMIREQRGNGEPRENARPAKRGEEQRRNGKPHAAPTAGGVTRKQE